ncbi:hypothetical protein ZWY2020_010036 [Hordeum vulgare]|nr:hypothetical protein ZWY2020_010036 [Hordeum vulgare]
MLLLFAGGSPAIGARWSSGAEVTGSRELSSLAAGGARGQPTSSPLLASWALCIFVIPCFSNGHSGRDSQSRAKPAPTHSDRLVLPHGCQRPELRPVHDSCSANGQSDSTEDNSWNFETKAVAVKCLADLLLTWCSRLFALILAAYVGDCCAMAHDNEADVVADSGATIVVPISAQHKINEQ